MMANPASDLPGVSLRQLAPPVAASMSAEGVAAGIRVAVDYPTEFSVEVAASIDDGAPLGPFLLHRVVDDVVIGEIGCAFVAPRIVEIGYAIVASAQGLGYATDAVLAFTALARAHPDIDELVAHTPLDRPASARVLMKAGFQPLGRSLDDNADGQVIVVDTWRLTLAVGPQSEANEP